MRRVSILLYGFASYAVFFLTFLYAAGFLVNRFVPRGIDSAPLLPLGGAILINSLLLALFAVQHSVMARPAFKQRWTRIIPPEAERSTYVLLSSLALILLFILWQPMGGTIWHVTNPAARAALYALFAAGLLTVLVATFLINHFDLFGLRQVWLYFRGRPYTQLKFVTPGPYRVVRHPLYVGWLLTFWSTPDMTAAHLLFAVLTTAYILLAIRWEERDLADAFGETYRQYQREVPKLIPRPRRSVADTIPGFAATTPN